LRGGPGSNPEPKRENTEAAALSLKPFKSLAVGAMSAPPERPAAE